MATKAEPMGRDDDGWQVEKLYPGSNQVLYSDLKTSQAFLADVQDLELTNNYLSNFDMGIEGPLEDASWSGPAARRH